MNQHALSPDLSVVVPVYNGETYLRWTLQCLADLDDHLRCEVIVQNACSTDNTGSLVEEFRQNRPHWRHVEERDAGQSDAINRGMALTTGRWVTWLCADDLLLPALAKTLVEADQHCADIVYGDVFFALDNALIPATGTETHAPGRLAGQRLIIQQPGTCIRRQVWHQAQGVRNDLNWTMDYDLFLRLEAQGRKFRRARTFVALARLHADAKTSSGSVRRLLELWRVLWAAHRRRPRFFRPRPYVLYFWEYLIKSMEAGAGPVSPLKARIMPAMHAIFWFLARPREEAEIRARFTQSLPETTKKLTPLGIPPH
ncbi:glycosyltransferase [Desulfonatronum parangueonense]